MGELMADEAEVILEPEESKTAPEVVSAEEGIDALKAKLAEEQTARQAAEATAAEATRRANAARTEAVDGRKEAHEANVALVTNAIETLKGSQDALEASSAAAAEAGDWANFAKFQRQISENAAKLATLEEGKTALDKGPQEPKIEPITDPVEALAVQLTPRSAAWVRAHPEYARDPAKFQQMIGADSLARGRGIAADTEAYFADVETTLGIRKAAAVAEPDPENPLSSAAERREAPPPAAPVGKQHQNGTVMRLTAEEREIAQMNGMTDSEYAQQKAAIAKERGSLN